MQFVFPPYNTKERTWRPAADSPRFEAGKACIRGLLTAQPYVEGEVAGEGK